MMLFKLFLKSPYFSTVAIFAASLLTGLLIALFPYHDVSVKNMSSLAVFLVFVLTGLVAWIIITWVMFVSFLLDGKYDWHEAKSGRIVRQVLYGGLLPLTVIIIYEILFYGYELLESEAYHYVFALQLILLYLINDRGYMIYLQNRKGVLKEKILEYQTETQRWQQEYDVLSEKYDVLQSALAKSREQKRIDDERLQGYIDQVVGLSTALAEKETMLKKALFSPVDSFPFVVKLGNIEKVYFEESILGFEIDGEKHKKPLIYLRANTGDKLLTSESSLESLNKNKFPHFLRLNRQYLVSPRSIISYKMDEGEGCWVDTPLSELPLHVSKDTWKNIAEQVRMIIANKDQAS